jgi:excisionase family DNA binding protein
MKIILLQQAEYDALCELVKNVNVICAELACKMPKDRKRLWMTNSEVCQLLDVTPRTLHNYRKEKKIAYSRIGNQYSYKISDVKRFIEKFRVEKLKTHKTWNI